MIRVLVVDDHALVRAGLCRLLNEANDIEVVGDVGLGRDAIRFCREHRPDVVVLDYTLPDTDGLEATRQIVALDLNIRVLILTMHSNEEYATRLLRAGASGFVVKDTSEDDLLTAVRKVSKREVFVTPSIMEKMVTRIGQPTEDSPELILSDRELQVLLLLARSSTSREVSKKLGISLSTVETYRRRILDKLNLRNNSDITRFAIRRKLIDAE